MSTATLPKGRVEITVPASAVDARAPTIQKGPTPAKPGHDGVRLRAYELYRARLTNGVKGDAVSDWLQAERELIARAAPAPRPARDAQTAHEVERGETLLHSGD